MCITVIITEKMLFGERKKVNAKRKRLQLPKWSECWLLWKL